MRCRTWQGGMFVIIETEQDKIRTGERCFFSNDGQHWVNGLFKEISFFNDLPYFRSADIRWSKLDSVGLDWRYCVPMVMAANAKQATIHKDWNK